VALVVDPIVQLALLATDVPALATIDATVVGERLATILFDARLSLVESPRFAVREVALFDPPVDAPLLPLLDRADVPVVGEGGDRAGTEQAGGEDEARSRLHTSLLHVACHDACAQGRPSVAWNDGPPTVRA
jgi:hypothetical protein